jgi:hypothetical protein
MGCGVLLLTDTGRYPEGMEDGTTKRVYDSVGDAVRIVRECFSNMISTKRIAASGLALVKERCSEGEQYRNF